MSMCTLSIHDERMGKNFIFSEKKRNPTPNPGCPECPARAATMDPAR